MSLPLSKSIALALVMSAFAAGGAMAEGWAGADPTSGDGSSTDNERLLPGVLPPDPTLVLAVPPPETNPVFFETEFSIGLRGSYTEQDGETRKDALLVPQFSLTHEGRRANLAIEGGAELAVPVEGEEMGVRALDLNIDGDYAIDSLTTVAAGLGVRIDTPLADLGDTTISEPASSIALDADAAIQREFGLFNLGVDGVVARTIYGDTARTDGTTSTNEQNNLTSLEAGLRLGYELTPNLELFGRASAGKDMFDAADPSSGIRADARDYAFSAGVLGTWNTVFEAQASIGAGLRQFDEASLGEIRSTLFEASLTYRPDPTLAIAAAASTDIEPGGADALGLARQRTTASAEVDYAVNRSLGLRASAEWFHDDFVDTDARETGYGAEIGADYLVNTHTSLSADYRFSRLKSSLEPSRDTHTVTLGVTVSR